ncbi:MAG: CU044_2847 family protein [Synechococcales bacterium]|nr:CU044_2847 family protein [Synechococcales bacterium]
MSEIQPILLESDDGSTYTIFVESKTPVEVPDALPSPGTVDDDDRESYGITEDTLAKLKEIHGTIRAYAWYAIGAFKNFGGAEIEEMTLKFGLKIGGKTGVPIVTEGSAEANFEISVKCKFPKP